MYRCKAPMTMRKSANCECTKLAFAVPSYTFLAFGELYAWHGKAW